MKTNPLTETKTSPCSPLLISGRPSSEAAMQARLQQQKKYLNKEASNRSNINVIYNCVGVIRAKWYNKNHELMTFSYGTAFQVSPRILLTCTHNLFSKFRSTWAHEVEFVPGIQQGEVEDYCRNVRRSLGFQGKLQMEALKVRYVYSLFDLEKEPMLKDCVSFENSPQNYEVSLVVLQKQANQRKEEMGERHQLCQNNGRKSIEGERVKDIGKKDSKENYISLRKYSLNEPAPLIIIGYPSQRFRTCMRFDKAYVNRSVLLGPPYLSKTQEKDNIIHYRIGTSVGMSGSPILVRDNNTYSAVGIHTHRGQEPGYNSGIYFDAEMIERIKELERKIEVNEKIERSIHVVDIQQGIRQRDEKEENDQDTPSPKEYRQKENNQRVSQPMDEYALPQQKELSDEQFENMSKMSKQSDSKSKPSVISQISKNSKISKASKEFLMPRVPNELSNEPEMAQMSSMSCMSNESPDKSSQSSDWSNASKMSQLDGIQEFFTLVKEPLCDSRPISVISKTHSCDLSKLSYARLTPYSNLLAQQGRTGSRIAHF